MLKAWQEGWPERFDAIIQNMGYDSTYDFVFSHPGQSFGEMFRAVRDSIDPDERPHVAFVQLAEVFYITANHRGQLRAAMMEALVRSLRQFLRKGWNQGKKIRERRGDAQFNWPTPDFVPYQEWSHSDWRKFQRQIWAEIESIGPPDDWCPEDYNDPIIQEAFERAWPVS